MNNEVREAWRTIYAILQTTGYENYSGEIERMKKCIDELQQENEQLKADYGTQAQIERDMLQQENKILKENAENNDKVVDKVNWENMLLKKENQELKDNWSKLKEWIEEGMKNSLHIPYECELDFEDVLDKMQEIEGVINGKI